MVIGSPDLSEREPINSLSYVRYVRTSVRSSVRSGTTALTVRFFLDFLHEVVSPYDLDEHQNFFRSKNFSTENFFGGHLSHMETQLHAKNFKKIERSRL